MMDAAKDIAKTSRSSFYYAFNLLPEEKRDAMNTVYAFCRKTDDIIDEGNETDEIKFEKLHRWRVELERAFIGHSDYILLNKLGKTINKFNIPYEPFFELLKGMEMDLQNNRYLTFEDLRLYCYRVASTVGLMCIEIFGYKHKSAKEFAVNLGIALQLTNILRDIKKDSLKGRIYFLSRTLEKFSYNEEDIFKQNYDERFIALMKYEVERVEKFFENATENLNLDDKKAMFAARAMQHIYKRLLEKIINRGIQYVYKRTYQG